MSGRFVTSRDLDFWPFRMKISKLVPAAAGNVHDNFGFLRLFPFELEAPHEIDGQTHGQDQ